MKKYKVIWEVSMEAIVEAESAEQAEEIIMSGHVTGGENELTSPPVAYLVV